MSNLGTPYGVLLCRRELRDFFVGDPDCAPARWRWSDHLVGILNRPALARWVLSIATSIAIASAASAAPAQASEARLPGAVWAWGQGIDGQLGNGGHAPQAAPVSAGGLVDVSSLATGYDYSLALKSDGTLVAWGANEHGQLGDGSTLARSTPVPVAGLHDVSSFATGVRHSLAVTSDGKVWTWGLGNNGLLGVHSNKDSSIPLEVPGMGGARAVAAASGQSIVVKSDGTVWVWGDGTDGTSYTPVQVRGIAGAIAVSAGEHHALALTSDGAVYAWGQGSFGQLGTGSTAGHSPATGAVRVPGLSGVTAIAAGNAHSLALSGDGSIWAWGANNHGQLGAGSTDTCNDLACSRNPLRMSALDGVTAIAAGTNFSLALKGDHTVWGWGWNGLGQLGDGSTSDSRGPAQVVGLTGVRAIAAGNQHSLAIATPIVSVSAASLSFGEQAIGTTAASQTISVANDGSAPLNAPLVGLVTLNGPNLDDFATTADTCSLAPTPAGGSCSMTISFTPRGLGDRTATVVLADNSLGSPHTFALSGAGALNLSPASLRFGEQAPGTTSAVQSVVVDVGTTSLALGNIEVTGDFAMSHDCPMAPLTVKGTCTLQVSFRPGTTGGRTGTLTVTHDGLGSPHRIALSGGTAAPDPDGVETPAVAPTGTTVAPDGPQPDDSLPGE